MSFKKAERKKAFLRLAIDGASGSGKTFTALLIAFGLQDAIFKSTGERVNIGVIDSERGSSNLYDHLGEFFVSELSPPYTVEAYLKQMVEAYKAGIGILIMDQISHAWAGEGGLLEQKEAQAAVTRNDYTAWGKITPLHQRFLEKIQAYPGHLIATMRSKQIYELVKNNQGKLAPVKQGTAPVQREGIDYEFTVCFTLTQEHYVTVSKDRTSLFDGGSPFVPNSETGLLLYEWLEGGAADKPLPTETLPETATQVVENMSSFSEPVVVMEEVQNVGTSEEVPTNSTTDEEPEGMDLFEAVDRSDGSVTKGGVVGKEVTELTDWCRKNKYNVKNFARYLHSFTELGGFKLACPIIGTNENDEPSIFKLARRYISYWRGAQDSIGREYERFLKAQLAEMGVKIEMVKEVLEGEEIDPKSLPKSIKVEV